MTPTQLKNKYRGLWFDVYEAMLIELQLIMPDTDINKYRAGKKNCKIITIAHNAAFIACYELDSRLKKISI